MIFDLPFSFPHATCQKHFRWKSWSILNHGPAFTSFRATVVWTHFSLWNSRVSVVFSCDFFFDVKREQLLELKASRKANLSIGTSNRLSSYTNKSASPWESSCTMPLFYKRLQSVKATLLSTVQTNATCSPNIVRRSMLLSFVHHVGQRWMMLAHVAWSFKLLTNIGQHFFCSRDRRSMSRSFSRFATLLGLRVRTECLVL